MCLILFSWDEHPKYKLIVAANRDEFYERPSDPLNVWPDHEHVIAGRDRTAGGTWLGISENGKFTALTNYRDPQNINPNAPSRGDLTKNFLIEEHTPQSYFNTLHPTLGEFNGFNLLLGSSKDGLGYFNSEAKAFIKLSSGIYGLSNAFLDTPWPKVEKAKQHFSEIIKSKEPEKSQLLDFLQDEELAPDEKLPSTGVPYEWEKQLSAMYIQTEKYGTCCSTVLLIDYQGRGTIIERTYPVGSRSKGEKKFEFKW